jgi:hypothetical protein
MSEVVRTLIALVLLGCASMYFGTGWSLVLFQLPDVPRLGPDTYALPFVKPVERATKFFTWMTIVMLIAGVVLVIGEWHSGYVWVPIVYLAAVVAATQLTRSVIFPLNARMEAGMTDPAEVRSVLSRWARLNRLRAGIWTVEWVVIAAYFGLRAT